MKSWKPARKHQTRIVKLSDVNKSIWLLSASSIFNKKWVEVSLCGNWSSWILILIGHLMKRYLWIQNIFSHFLKFSQEHFYPVVHSLFKNKRAVITVLIIDLLCHKNYYIQYLLLNVYLLCINFAISMVYQIHFFMSVEFFDRFLVNLLLLSISNLLSRIQW